MASDVPVIEAPRSVMHCRMPADRLMPSSLRPDRSSEERSARLPSLPPLSIQARCRVSMLRRSSSGFSRTFAITAADRLGERSCAASRMAPIRLVLVKLARPMAQPVITAPDSRAPDRFASDRSASVRSQPVRLEFVRFARMNFVPRRIASVRSVCITKAFATLARDRSAPRMTAAVSSDVRTESSKLCCTISPEGL